MGESEDRIMATTRIVSNAWSKIAARVHRHLNVVAFNPNGIARQRYGHSKQLQELHINVALTHLKPHERVFIPNYHIYRTDRFPGRKGGTGVTVRKGIPTV
jgi:hypothetical protein